MNIPTRTTPWHLTFSTRSRTRVCQRPRPPVNDHSTTGQIVFCNSTLHQNNFFSVCGFFFVTLFSETFFLSLCLSVAFSFCHSIILRLFVSVTFISATFSFWDFSSCDSVVKRLFVSVTLSFLDCLFSLSFFLWYVPSATFPFSSLAFCFWLSRFSILVTQKFLK